MGPQTLQTPAPHQRTSTPSSPSPAPGGATRPLHAAPGPAASLRGAARQIPQAGARHPRGPTSKVVVPVRYAAWLQGDLGRTLERTFAASMEPFGDVRITRLPRALLVEADEEPGPLLEAVHRAVVALEAGIASAYPVLHHEMGPLWTGTLQAVFS